MGELFVDGRLYGGQKFRPFQPQYGGQKFRPFQPQSLTGW